MLQIRLIFLGTLLFLWICFIPTGKANELPIELFKTTLQKAWQNGKFPFLTSIVGEMAKQTTGNITIVASQAVYNDDNTFKEIKTFEMVIPNWDVMLTKKHDGITMELTEFLALLRLKDSDELRKVTREFKEAHKLGLDYEGVQIELSDDGTEEYYYYMDRNTVYFVDKDGFGYYLKDNYKPTEMEIRDFKKILDNRTNETLLTVLEWDTEGKLIEDTSIVNPMTITFIEEASDATEEMMRDAAEVLTYSVIRRSSHLAKDLVDVMTSKHSDYVWHASKSSDSADYINKDIYIRLNFVELDLWMDASAIELFGTK